MPVKIHKKAKSLHGMYFSKNIIVFTKMIGVFMNHTSECRVSRVGFSVQWTAVPLLSLLDDCSLGPAF